MKRGIFVCLLILLLVGPLDAVSSAAPSAGRLGDVAKVEMSCDECGG